MDLIQALILGIVQGATEWLPISSTGHLRVMPALFGWGDPGAAFTAVIQLGTMMAVILYFAKDLAAALSAWFRSLAGGPKDTPEARIGWGVFWGTLPIVVVGFLFRDQIRSADVRSLYVVAGALIVGGILMLAAEQIGAKRRTAQDIRVQDGWIVGFFQTLSLIPGMSRSGSTISGALIAGLDRPTAARYSFLLSVPSVVASGLFELYNARDRILGEQLGPVIVAAIAAFAVGYGCIAFLMKFLQKHGIGVFVLYRFALAALLIGMVQSGRLPAKEPTVGEPPSVQR